MKKRKRKMKIHRRKIPDSRRAWVKKMIGRWRSRLFLGEWFIDIEYHDDINSKAAAQCDADPVYMTAKIRIYPCFWYSSRLDREMILVHELCHCITQSAWNCMASLLDGQLVTKNQQQCELERLTQRITNIAFQQKWGNK
jgi:hypothetical protein